LEKIDRLGYTDIERKIPLIWSSGCNAVDWTSLVVCSVDLLNAAQKMWLRVRGFLVNWKTVSLSRITVLHGTESCTCFKNQVGNIWTSILSGKLALKLIRSGSVWSFFNYDVDFLQRIIFGMLHNVTYDILVLLIDSFNGAEPSSVPTHPI
jgi:hypothetical protein